MKVGVKDIAQKAGVSPATVSNVLNQRANVSQSVRNRVLDICREMDYHVKTAKKLRQASNTGTVLFIFSDFNRQFYLKVLQGVNDYVCAHGYHLIICTCSSYERFMTSRFTNGCIMLDSHCTNEFLVEKARQGYPIVTLDRSLDEANICNLLVNNYKPMAELVTGLVERGYRDFAFLGGLDTLDTQERYTAFRDVLARNGIPFPRERYLTGDFRQKSGNRIAQLLMISENLPEVLVCANDDMAIGAIQAFRAEGIRIPEDIAVTGFDGLPLTRVLDLTTVVIPFYERGYLAAQHLLSLIEGEPGVASHLYLQAKVKWRGSVQAAVGERQKV